MVLMSGHAQEKRRFSPPWRVERTLGGFAVYDANRTRLAWTCGRDDLQQYASGDQHMTTDEARRIALAIARSPELTMK
jgi:hypothetical protein